MGKLVDLTLIGFSDSGLLAKGTKMTLLPETQTVLRGEETRFTCRTTQPQWGAMIWQLNGRTVLTIHQKHGIVPSINPNITAEKSSTPQEDGWVLVLKNTNRQQQGDVTCDLQDVDKKTASLFVQGVYIFLGKTNMSFVLIVPLLRLKFPNDLLLVTKIHLTSKHHYKRQY